MAASLYETIDPEWFWVALGFFLFEFVNIFMIGKVAGARKKFGVSYPELYRVGDKYDEYNRIQRAHQNTLTENFPMYVIRTLLASLSSPKWAGILLILWAVSRVFYMIGYSKSVASRAFGNFGYFALLGQVILFGNAVYQLFLRNGGVAGLNPM